MFKNSIHGFLTNWKKSINSDLLKKCNENDPFLKRLITGDEKYCLQQYQAEKMVEQVTWTSSNNIKSWYIRQKKVLLSIWWDYKRIVYFELLPPNRPINSIVYIEQLTKLNNAVEEKPNWQIEKVLYSIMTMQGHTHHSAKIIGAWLGCFAISTI